MRSYRHWKRPFTDQLRLFTALVLLICAGAGCARDLGWPALKASIRAQYPDIDQIQADSLAAWLQKPDSLRPLLLDVRTQEEYEVSHLAGAVRVEPETPDFSFLNETSRDHPVVAYCSVGYRSSELAQRLKKAGFTNVSNLEGSIFEWANRGYPVYRNGRQVRQVHPYDPVWGKLLRPPLRAPNLDADQVGDTN